MKIDMHVHLTGVGTGDSGCWISPAFRSRITFQALRLMHGITREQLERDADAYWAAMVAARVEEAELDRAVVLGFDGVFREDGSMDQEHSQMIVPPEWVERCCHRHPNLLPGPSIHPYRTDAVERFERAVEAGATLIKWLPISQGMDPAHPLSKRIYPLLREAGVPLLVHMGGERTFATIAPRLNDVTLLRAPLDAGVKVIAAHTATRVLASREPDQTPRLLEMFRQYPHLWVDNSGMLNPARYSHVPQLAQDSRFWERTLFGSDFPVPSNAIYFVRELGAREVLRLERIHNPIQRELETKRALGYPDRTLTRAAEVLANLERWG